VKNFLEEIKAKKVVEHISIYNMQNFSIFKSEDGKEVKSKDDEIDMQLVKAWWPLYLSNQDIPSNESQPIYEIQNFENSMKKLDQYKGSLFIIHSVIIKLENLCNISEKKSELENGSKCGKSTGELNNGLMVAVGDQLTAANCCIDFLCKAFCCCLNSKPQERNTNSKQDNPNPFQNLPNHHQPKS